MKSYGVGFADLFSIIGIADTATILFSLLSFH